MHATAGGGLHATAVGKWFGWLWSTHQDIHKHFPSANLIVPCLMYVCTQPAQAPSATAKGAAPARGPPRGPPAAANKGARAAAPKETHAAAAKVPPATVPPAKPKGAHAAKAGVQEGPKRPHTAPPAKEEDRQKVCISHGGFMGSNYMSRLHVVLISGIPKPWNPYIINLPISQLTNPAATNPQPVYIPADSLTNDYALLVSRIATEEDTLCAQARRGGG